MKIDNGNQTPSISKSRKAAVQLAETAPEREAFFNLLRQQPVVNAKTLTTEAADGAADLYNARRNLTNRRNEQLANALRLALALSLNRKKLDEFYQNKFWDYKRPNEDKLLLSCLQFATQPRNDNERKLLSKYAAAVNWLVLRGYGPDDLAQGIMKEGGNQHAPTSSLRGIANASGHLPIRPIGLAKLRPSLRAASSQQRTQMLRPPR